MADKAEDIKKDDTQVMGDAEFDLAFEANAADEGKTPEEIAEAEKLAANEGKTPEEIAEAEKLAANEGKTPEEIAEAEKLAANEGKTPEEIAEAEKLAANEGKTPEEIAEAEKLAAAKVDPAVAAAQKIITDAAQQVKTDAAQKVTDAATKKLEDEAKALEVQNKKDLEHTDEEKESIKVFKKDWKDIDKAVSAKNRVMLVEIKQEVAKGIAEGLAAVRAEFTQAIAPLATSTALTAKERFNADIEAVHADARTLLPEIENWIVTQPDFMQVAYNKVLDGGTAVEVNALYTVFKDATGRTKVPEGDKTIVDEAAVEAARKKKEAEREKKLASQAGVKSKSTAKATSVDQDDFDGAFNEEAAK